MPEMKHYIVTQTREVHVSANSAKDAGVIAAAAFEYGQNSSHGVIKGPAGVWGNTDTQIRVISMQVNERR